MANFSSDDYSSQNYNALNWGLPQALSLPAINTVPSGATPAIGWYAADNGLVRRVSGFKRKNANDFRRYYLDLSALTEIQAGDTLTTASDVSVLAAPNSISAGNYAVSGNRVFFTLEAGIPNLIYAIQIRCKLTSNTIISRVVRVIVDEYD